MFDYLIVGAGFTGSVLAERLARGSDKKVLICDKRPHIGGNAYDCTDAAGVLIHQYGPHIFHTNSADVFGYLSRFTKWRQYQHRVLASVDGKLVPIPINLDTINALYGLNFDSDQVAEWLASRAEKVEKIRTSEDVVVSKIGRELYEKFFKGYTRKQWGLDPSELDVSVTSRVPTRTNRDARYFTDTFQAMPLRGYAHLFDNMLDHSNIFRLLNCDYRDVKNSIPYKEIIYTGPIDEFFDFRFGKLPYRSLRFEWETRNEEYSQPVAQINYPSEEVPFTRQTEYKHLTGQKCAQTTISREYSQSEGEPYYPVPRPQNTALYKRYQELAVKEKNLHFAGRLATYRYYNMDQVVAQALSLYKKISAAPFHTRPDEKAAILRRL